MIIFVKKSEKIFDIKIIFVFSDKRFKVLPARSNFKSFHVTADLKSTTLKKPDIGQSTS